jgi:hypothetical protein
MPKRNNQFAAVLRIVAVGEERVFPSGFRKRELLVCDDDPKYPVTFPLEFSGDNVDRAAPALAFLTGTTDWVHVSIEFVSKKNTNIGSLAFVQPRITNATGTAWFDDILIEELK